jgi:phosphate transport system substrate-binding protein
MSNYYKIVGGCKKCQRKGIFQPNQDQTDTWDCPYRTPDCEGQLVASSWAMKNIKPIRLIAIAAIVIGALGYFLIGGGNSDLKKSLNTVDGEIQTFEGAVRKLPQNTGSINPQQALWVSRFQSKIKTLKDQPNDDVRGDMEKLKELKDDLSVKLGKEKKEKNREFKPAKTLAKYSKLKNEGRGILNRLGSIKSRAKIAESDALLVKVKQSEKKLKSSLKDLTKKSRLIKGGNQPASGEDIVASSVAAVEQAMARVDKAMMTLADEIAAEKKRIDEAAEKARLAAIAAEEARTAAEKRRFAEEQARLWNAAKPTVTVIVSDPLRSSLISKLAQGYLTHKAQPLKKLEKGGVIRYTSADETIEVKNESHGGGPASQTVSVVVKGSNYSAPNTKVIALDAMVAVVHPGNPVSQITSQQLDEISAGKITNWSQVGGPPATIRLRMPSPGSSDFSVIDAEAANLLQNNQTVTKLDLVTPSVARDTEALGIAAFHSSGRVKRLSIGGIKPTPSSISSENYRYCKRVYAKLPGAPDKALNNFLAYIKSNDGQKIVSQAGYIDLRVQIGKPVSPSSWPIIESATGWEVISAFRLNTNLRFATGKSTLDVKAKADISRIQQILKLHLSGRKKALVIGFTDSVGSSQSNQKLSEDRSLQVSRLLKPAVVGRDKLKSTGLGAALPVSDNTSEIGKSKNRRVEVWIVETKL